MFLALQDNFDAAERSTPPLDLLYALKNGVRFGPHAELSAIRKSPSLRCPDPFDLKI
jgi:hypothetical protein